jgi:hypothetical protein
LQVKSWAREHNVPPSTVYHALRRGRITRTADGLDLLDAATWLRSRKDTISEERTAEAGRQQVRDPMAAEAVTDIHRLWRQLAELRATTVAADETPRERHGTGAGSGSRRLWRPCRRFAHAAEVADAVQRPPAAVAKVLVELVIRDLGELAGK